MAATNRDDVSLVLGRLGEARGRFQEAAIRAFLHELLSLNPRLGLISRKDPVPVAARLVRRSLDLWDFVSPRVAWAPGRPVRTADIGPGGGFPSLIWKLVEPALRLTLIERKSRRAQFLERIVLRLALSDVEVLEMDVRDVGRLPERAGAYDLVTYMAVSPIEELSAAIESLLRRGGYHATIRPRSEEPRERAGQHLVLAASAVDEHATYLLYQRATDTHPPE